MGFDEHRRKELSVLNTRPGARARNRPPPGFLEQQQVIASNLNPDLARRFAEFDAENPHVWREFERFALRLARSGAKRGSADMVMQRVRWETSVETVGDRFKVSDHWTAFYARRFVAVHPEYAGLFEMRHSAADLYEATKPASLEQAGSQQPSGN